MKLNKATLLASLLAATGLMGLHTGSYAAVSTQSGADCKPYGYSNTGGIYSGVTGTFNYTGATASLVCPVTRVSAPTAGWGIWLDGYIATAGQTTSCWVYSYNFTGTFIAAVPVSVTATSNGQYWDRFVSLTAAQAPTFSQQTVYCSVPNNGGILDVEPSI